MRYESAPKIKDFRGDSFSLSLGEGRGEASFLVPHFYLAINFIILFLIIHFQ